MKNSVLQYFIHKTMEIILTLFIVTLLSFLLMRLSPFDPATAYVKRNNPIVTEEKIQAARIELGLDKPLWLQYGTWVKNALQLDYGISLASGHTVAEEIGKAIPVSVAVVLIAAVIMDFGILLVGCMNYIFFGRNFGYVLTFLCIAGISIPEFYLASSFIDTFAIKLGIISVAGNTGIMRYIPAAFCLSVSGIA